MFDVNSNNASPVVNYEGKIYEQFKHLTLLKLYIQCSSDKFYLVSVIFIGVSKNVMAVGFQEAGRWMYTGGEDGTAKIW